MLLDTHVLAQTPVPARKLDLKGQLAEKQVEKDELERQAASAQKQLQETRVHVIKTAKRVQKNQKSLFDLETTLSDLDSEKKEIEDRLENERTSIAGLVMALQRISRMPPQAMLARPGSHLETAQTAMLIRDVIPEIKTRTDRLKEDLTRLENIEDQTREKKKIVETTLIVLQKEEKQLNTLVAKREKSFRAANRDLVAKQQDIERISLQAKNLNDLVKRLNQNERTHNLYKQRTTKKTTSLPRSGQAQLPMPGRILVSYHEPDAFGAPSEGLTIEGRPKALVVAPMGGIIRFTGYFKNYGTMVIIEHENKYHSLIAGFEKVDTLVGQRVGAGEPLGKLHKKKNGKMPKLYYELRKNGKPVNPATRLSGVS